jgi:cytochrome c peroxidase
MASFYSHRRRPPSYLFWPLLVLLLVGSLFLERLLTPIQAGFRQPTPQATTSNEQQALITLGRMLWYDRRLSYTGEQSCNTCHMLERYGVDGLPVSLKADRQPGQRNAPSIYGAHEQIALFWDGRSDSLQSQAASVLLDPDELAMPYPDYVVQVIESIPGYRPYFAAAFPDQPESIGFDQITAALAAFQVSLRTPSRFDAFLLGDRQQLTPAEQAGMATFVRVGCATCHNGPTVGGQQFRRLGEVEAYPTEDVGRFAITGQPADIYVFKVPSLRNVAETGPYLHDGSIQTLAEVVRIMGRYQLGITLSDREVTEILAFLQSLTGELPYEAILPPQLPPNGPTTPRRDRSPTTAPPYSEPTSNG